MDFHAITNWVILLLTLGVASEFFYQVVKLLLITPRKQQKFMDWLMDASVAGIKLDAPETAKTETETETEEVENYPYEVRKLPTKPKYEWPTLVVEIDENYPNYEPRNHSDKGWEGKSTWPPVE